jgi:hypothetical protein
VVQRRRQLEAAAVLGERELLTGPQVQPRSHLRRKDQPALFIDLKDTTLLGTQ